MSWCFGAASPAPSAPRGTELDSASTGLLGAGSTGGAADDELASAETATGGFSRSSVGAAWPATLSAAGDLLAGGDIILLWLSTDWWPRPFPHSPHRMMPRLVTNCMWI